MSGRQQWRDQRQADRARRAARRPERLGLSLPDLTRAKAETWPVDEDNPVAAGEMLAERQFHILEVAAGAVQKDNGKSVRISGPARQLDDMLVKTADVNKSAPRQMSALNQPRTNESDDGAGAEDRDDNCDRGH